MIFVTLGTHEQPFTRAVDCVADVVSGRERILIQHGTTPARPQLPGTEWIAYLEWDILNEAMHDAEAVITHAGVGSTVTAIKAGKKPIMLPRLARFGEHVDDHQLQLAERFAAGGLAFACHAGDSLLDLVNEARGGRAASFSGHRPSGLRRAVAQAAAIA